MSENADVFALKCAVLSQMDKYMANAPDGAVDACSMEADIISSMTDAEFLTWYAGTYGSDEI